MPNIGQNLFEVISTNLQPLVLIGMVIFGVILLFKRKITEFIGFSILSVIVVGLVFQPQAVVDLFLNFFSLFTS